MSEPFTQSAFTASNAFSPTRSRRPHLPNPLPPRQRPNTLAVDVPANGTVTVTLPDGVTDSFESAYEYQRFEQEFSYELQGEALRIFCRTRRFDEPYYGADARKWTSWEEAEVAFYRPEQWTKVLTHPMTTR